MSTKYWILVFLLGVFVAACSPAEAINVQNSALQSPIPESNGQVLTETDILVIEVETPTPAATQTPVAEDSRTDEVLIATETEFPAPATPVCEDPFAGESVRFSTQYWNTNFCLHSIPYSEIFSGGPPPDGIPPIDNPKFVAVQEADTWLEDREPVIFFQEGEDTRAYPLQILIWHEIVNDTVGGRPVVVTFCPLCNTALVFERPLINGSPLTFGTSGNLRNSDLVMYDRQTESWWQQFSGEAIVGDQTGEKLDFLASSIVSWADFKSQNPDGQILSLDTGYNRRYGSNPYPGYDNVDQAPFLYSGSLDDRLRPMERILGIMLPEGNSVAYTISRLREDEVINSNVGELPIVVFWKPGTASALDSSDISLGKDIGSTGVFLRTIENKILIFTSIGDGLFQDEQTESTWDLSGKAIAGLLQGSQLSSIPHHETFWFAWAAFVHPDTLHEE